MTEDRGVYLRLLSDIRKAGAEFYKAPDKYLDSIIKLKTRQSEVLAGLAVSAKESGSADTTTLDKIISELAMLAQRMTVKNDIKPVSVDELPGIGKKATESLKKQHIETVEDVLYNFPYRYEYIGESRSGKKALTGIFQTGAVVTTKNRKRIYKAVFSGDFGQFAAVWFRFSAGYPAGVLKEGKKYTIYGQSGSFSGMESIIHPQFMKESEMGNIIPVYSLPKSVAQKVYYTAVNAALDKYLDQIPDHLPARLEEKYKFPSSKQALLEIHRPKNPYELEALSEKRHPAAKRFIYEELFYLQMGLLYKKRAYERQSGTVFDIKKEYLDWIKDLLPFKFTGAQRRVMAEIFNDMSSTGQMNRLVQGDVGSGKTIVAFTAGLVAVKNGYQVAVIAPTEVLARQHMLNLLKLISGTNVTAVLLTGSVSGAEKKHTKELIAAGHVDFVLGTHAVIQEDADFAKLGLAIIDEQHRFGVEQRKSLIEKGYMPDILLMTATPIPRTLALSFYGDLDISIIDELPPGRTPINTVSEKNIERVYPLMREEIKKGHGVYVIYPLIDTSEKLDLKAATDEHRKLSQEFGADNVGLLHGRMKHEQKSELMDAFKAGNIQVLVSTTVIEVGVDVPHATVMVIENAERFGLSQLHQLRGRVGRSDRQSYCVLVASENVSDEASERINAMCAHADGFKLSEIDLEMRGPGDFFGTRQSGLPEFRFSNIVRDVRILQDARSDAADILSDDQDLSSPKNTVIKQVLIRKWRSELQYIEIG
ncbi:ATP-dependent DNA helicase RecG [Denitrovibrio acetiphilus DSM 12809]|uniref:ATP-dependent DNA helicase RecG n=1 Tax=Denitrovibrio acetiphilus (strain DSM 12809 / NBRC 114555 / N2460) TaxID=522772 RepID=D4H848_DENA2|nr:ATP-dependent DNA helicase RecG [Denitrovibrio acetiphilus]ADD68197.1 ATP-dependent DNA helicase RecG [Denitrovibrio acetiphilus DSM 12809]